MHTIKLSAVGTSTGAIFPKEVLTAMKVAKGDTLYVIETPNGFLLTPYDPNIEEQLKAGQDFMKEYRDVFHTLAK